MNQADLKDLHDAQLASVSVDWAQKTVQMRVRHGWPSRWSELTMSGLRSLSMTTMDEWGPSVHIHRINIEPADNASRYLVEMQSGDVIDIVAASIELRGIAS